jgi:hypothetical protein
LLWSGVLADNTMPDVELMPLPQDGWRLVTDNVMGGVSEGRLEVQRRAERHCIALSGQVRTENNGGFVQMVLDLPGHVVNAATSYVGIRFAVHGNDQDYNLHLRTADLWLPWQSYRAGFHAAADWQVVELPFSAFTPYRTRAPLRLERLRRLGVVAIGKAFTADICVADLAFYRR